MDISKLFIALCVYNNNLILKLYIYTVTTSLNICVLLGTFIAKRHLNSVIIQARTDNGRLYGNFISDDQVFTVEKCASQEVSCTIKHVLLIGSFHSCIF